jgi:hypothetical protein
MLQGLSRYWRLTFETLTENVQMQGKNRSKIPSETVKLLNICMKNKSDCKFNIHGSMHHNMTQKTYQQDATL